jgi:hypothetical protein
MVVSAAQVGSGFMRVLSRRGGAEMGIPTIIGKEFAGMSRVKATIITAQSDGLP